MCENDAAVEAWFEQLRDEGLKKMIPGEMRGTSWTIGHLRGVVRELAATVPGVREWLIANPPGGK